MRRSTFLLFCLMGLVVTACSTVSSVMPVGDEPVYLEPEEWEGLWVHDLYDNGVFGKVIVETVTMRVVDAAGGILEYCDAKDCAKTVRAVVRQHRSEGGNAKFISQLTEEDTWGYAWGKYQRVGNALIIWPPVPKEFKNFIDKGAISGQKVGGDELLIDSLSNDQLDLISVDKVSKVSDYRVSKPFDYEFKDEDIAIFPNTVWFRTSTIPAPVNRQCTSQLDHDLHKSEGKALTSQAVSLRLGYSIVDIGLLKTSVEPGGPGRSQRVVVGDGTFQVTQSHRYGFSKVRFAINNAGQVLISEPGNGTVIWQDGTVTDVIRPLSDFISMNNSGLLAGWGNAGADNGLHAMLWDARHDVVDLGTLADGGSEANSLNDRGQVVGQSDTPDSPHFHAVLWDKGVLSDLGALGGDASSAQAINNPGQVVGSIYYWRGPDEPLVDPISKAFFWDRSSGMTELGTLGGTVSEANSINDKGEVVGTSKTVQGYLHGFIWRMGSGMVDLCTLGGRDSTAASINNAGQVVGWSEITWGDSTKHHAVLWDHNRIIDLSSLPEVKEAGWSELTEARGINDQGQIVGFGVREGKPHVFLLTPAPPPANGS